MKRRYSKGIVCGIVITLMLSVIVITVPINAAADPVIILVPDDYITIQDAIDAAGDGDTILLADGIYTGADNRDLQWDATVKHLTIKSINGPENCIIDCESSGRGFILNSGQDNSDVIDGLTITNGRSISQLNMVGGAAIFCGNTSPIIQNCKIINNSANSDGGGIMCYYGDTPIIRNCYIANNIGEHTGGGLHIHKCAPIIENNIITGNVGATCYGGGGIALILADSNTKIVGNLFTNNKANHHGKGGYGGGIICLNSGPLIAGNTFVNNTTSNGTDLGQGGAIRVGGWPFPVIRNCILWNNEGEAGHKELSRSAPTVDLDIEYSDIEGGLAGIVPNWELTNIDSDPLFAGGSPFDYRLSADSPCIDSGTPDTSGLHLPSRDLAGNPRITNERIDMGAYENGLIASWSMGEGSGTTIFDTTPGEHHGTIYDATWTTGISGSALHFDGTDNYVNVPDDPAFDFSQGATVEFWFKRAGGFGNAQYLVDKRTSCPGNSDFFFYLGIDNRLHGIYMGVSSGIISSIDKILDPNWHHAVFVYDDLNTALYLDGILNDQEPTTGTIVLGPGDINIGRAPSGLYFDGTLDEVSIWNHALTPEDITERFHRLAPVHNIDTDEYFINIQDAIDLANPGDTIQAAGITYDESIIINTPINLVGAGASTTIIDGGGSTAAVLINADNVEITGFTIQNGQYGILVDSTDGTVISGNTISNNNIGIKIDTSTNYDVNTNDFADNDFANIHVDPSYDGMIANNILSGTYIGIYIESSSPIIENNVIEGCYIGIYIESGSPLIFNNILIDNHYAIFCSPGLNPIIGYNIFSGNDVIINLISKELKENAVTKLEAAKSCDKKIDNGIDMAIDHIEMSLDNEYWQDDMHIASKFGHKVFAEEKQAVQKLEELMIHKDIPDSLKNTCSEVIIGLLTSDLLLVLTSLEEAQMYAGTSTKVDNEITLALDKYQAGGESLLKGHYGSVIDFYRQAWEHSQNAVSN
ncbi:MAG: right-handed parallel beta-helix repeat-containing protein [Thermoplasmata archaeon]|nr:MAG: right-handed parallel beta-helix repeat-containing protein [Thermoplasmata archaeon]